MPTCLHSDGSTGILPSAPLFLSKLRLEKSKWSTFSSFLHRSESLQTSQSRFQPVICPERDPALWSRSVLSFASRSTIQNFLSSSLIARERSRCLRSVDKLKRSSKKGDTCQSYSNTTMEWLRRGFWSLNRPNKIKMVLNVFEPYLIRICCSTLFEYPSRAMVVESALHGVETSYSASKKPERLREFI